jgi:hypothetical protein
MSRKPTPKQDPKRSYAVSASAAGWSLQSAARYSGIGYHSLLKLAKRGELPGIFVGPRFITPRKAFIAWFESQMPDAAA